jgi:hypothetical protein
MGKYKRGGGTMFEWLFKIIAWILILLWMAFVTIGAAVALGIMTVNI